jgi:peptide/nickel transport system permease protein
MLNRFGLALVILFVLTTIFANLISPHDPWERFEPYEKPSRHHILGTNDIGNDIFSELIHGSRASLIVGIGAAIIATLLGLLVGLFSGYFKGTLDEIFMGITDIFLMIPRIPLIIILAAFLKSSIWLIMLALGLLWWTSTARVVRSRTLQVREMDYVSSAKCLGFKSRHIIFSDILPNIIPVVVPKFMLTVATAMISEASLSFLGLGDPSMKSWGLMINFALIKGGLVNEMWWWYLPPGLCIILFVYSIVSLGFSFEEGEKWAYVR